VFNNKKPVGIGIVTCGFYIEQFGFVVHTKIKFQD
jgi:hypothetical protein